MGYFVSTALNRRSYWARARATLVINRDSYYTLARKFLAVMRARDSNFLDYGSVRFT